MTKTKYSKIGFVSTVALLGALTGCVGYVDDGSRHTGGYAPPPQVYVEPQVVIQDDYVYFPDYEVYYSSSRRQYIYLEGRSWVSRPSPRVSVNVLFAAPSVRLDFHDAPSFHHSMVVREYPKHWSPSGSNHGNHDGRDENHDEGHGNGKHKGKKGRD